MTLGSLFDGAGGFPYAGTLCGITPLWASEVEPYCIRVTSKRIPTMKHLGDISTIDGGKLPPVDIVTFGSPCTDLSVAGRQAGLKGERSGLFFEAIRIIREMRLATNNEYPKYAVWENVPGAFSSNNGNDFYEVLQEFVKLASSEISIPRPTHNKWQPAGEIVGDGYSVAWRVYDAQYWGVPQRRKRIYLVMDFGGSRAGKISFERESLYWDSPQGDSEGQEVTEATHESVGVASSTTSQAIGQSGIIGTVYGLCSKNSNSWKSSNPDSGCYVAETARTLDTNGGNPMCNQGGMLVVQPVVSGVPIVFEPGVASRDGGHIWTNGVAPTIRATPGDNHPTVVVETAPSYCLDRACYNQGVNALYGISVQVELAQTLVAKGPHAIAVPYMIHDSSDINGDLDTLYDDEHYAAVEVEGDIHRVRLENNELVYIVRKLTPLECCRLQGFPDYWCDDLSISVTEDSAVVTAWAKIFETHRKIFNPEQNPKSRKAICKWLQDPRSDSAEYKMWGNSLAIPCAYTVLAGIVEVEKGE